MTDHDDLIKRCREYAALLEGTRPGPWNARRHLLVVDESGKPVADAAAGYGDGTRNGPLIAAAPAMARLLAEVAEALEHLEGEDD